MTEKEIRKLSRADLLEMLIDQSTELQTLRDRLAEAESALHQKELAINTAGSIAEAALRLNGVFEVAQSACNQYMENIRLLSKRQEAICRKMEAETKSQCEAMVLKAKADVQAYWDEVSDRLDSYSADPEGFREFLSTTLSKKGQE